jgi:hypothetical protein
MKKSVILGILGLTAGVVTSFGQGTIQFDNYNSNAGNGFLTTYGSDQGANAGLGLSSSFTAALIYSLSPIVDAASSLGNTALNGGFSQAFQSPDATSGTTFMTAQFQTTSGGVAGYFTGAGANNLFRLPTYTSGNVYFEVIAYNGSSYANATVRGHSAAFSETLATGTTLAGFMDAQSPFSVFSVAAVPEPTTLALAGLGGLASLVMLRRKNA